MNAVSILFHEVREVNGVSIDVELMHVSPKADNVQRTDFFVLSSRCCNDAQDEILSDKTSVLLDATRENALRTAIEVADTLAKFYAEDDSDTSTQESIISSMRN